MVFTKVKTPEERFHSKYAVAESGCWEWQGANNSNGYGVFWDYDLGRNDGAHRASYRLFVGPIPDGLEIDHLCENTLCVNPAHLEPVTQEENKRRRAMRRTHCPNGHPWTAENTHLYRGHRRCRACNREQKRAETFCPVEERTHCGYGHEWTEENTYRDKHGYRYCRECRRINRKKWWAQKKAAATSSSEQLDNVRDRVDTGSTDNDGSK